MRTYHRSGVEIDQCTQCLGIFLDRGELPRLIEAEAADLYPQQQLPQSTPG
jgi:Zn-finger nucleic acid-binding protein